MKKIILWVLILVSATAYSYAQETNSTTVQPTAAATPNAGMATQPTATAALTPSTTDTKSSASPWYLSIGGGIDIPAQNWIPAYSLGGGGQLAVGYQAAKDWAIELDLDNFYFSGSSTVTGALSDYELRILPTVKYTLLTGSDLQPYVVAGSGIDMQFLDAPSGSALVTSFVIAAGLGMEWKMDSKLYLFAEGKWNLLMTDGLNNNTVTGQDFPVLAGVRLGLQ
jgi:hypothetical protein